jgi:hypothetical protein
MLVRHHAQYLTIVPNTRGANVAFPLRKSHYQLIAYAAATQEHLLLRARSR